MISSRSAHQTSPEGNNEEFCFSKAIILSKLPRKRRIHREGWSHDTNKSCFFTSQKRAGNHPKTLRASRQSHYILTWCVMILVPNSVFFFILRSILQQVYSIILLYLLLQSIKKELQRQYVSFSSESPLSLSNASGAIHCCCWWCTLDFFLATIRSRYQHAIPTCHWHTHA